jgi:hypothetical protein
MLFKTIMPQSLCDSFSVHNAFNCQNSGIFMQLLEFLKFICPQQFWKFYTLLMSVFNSSLDECVA